MEKNEKNIYKVRLASKKVIEVVVNGREIRLMRRQPGGNVEAGIMEQREALHQLLPLWDKAEEEAEKAHIDACETLSKMNLDEVSARAYLKASEDEDVAQDNYEWIMGIHYKLEREARKLGVL